MQSVAIRGSTGNDVSGPLFSPFFSFLVFPTAPTMSAVGKIPQLFSSFFSFSGPLSDWLEQTLVCSHWSTHSKCSTYSESVAIALAVVGMAMARPHPVGVGGIGSPHGCGCRGDGQPSSPWLSMVCPGLMAVAVVVMANFLEDSGTF